MSRSGIKVVFVRIVVVAVILASVWIGQESFAAAGKKPSPEPVWGFQAPFYGNLMGMNGGSFVYKNGDPNVSVTVQKGTSGPTVYRTTVNFKIYPSTNPPETYVLFNNVTLDWWNIAADPGPVPECGFASPFDTGGLPWCFLSFFNSDHPKMGYEHLLFNFWIQGDIEDLGTFPVGEEVKWTGSGAFSINIWNSFQPLSATDTEPYQTVVARLIGSDNEDPKGFYITRVDLSTWEFRIEQKRFDFSQSYSFATPATGKNGKPTYVITTYEPLTGEGDLSLKLRLIKNPS